VRVWDLAGGRCLHAFEGHRGGVTALAVTADGRAVSGSTDGTVRVWDLAGGRCLHAFEGHTELVTTVAVTADGRAVSGSEDGTVRVWDLAGGQCLALFPCEYQVRRVAVTSDRTPMIVAGLDDGQVQFFRHEGA
jgi:WD40 repeat protein